MDEELPLPSPDLPVVQDMQMAIASKLTDIQRQKAEGLPVVWCSVLTPKEILFSMDVASLCGNVLGAYASIFGMSARYCQLAEDDGIARDVCSVNRCTIGVCCTDDREGFFETAFAPPDLVIGSTFPCTAEGKTFLHVAKKYNVPYYLIDVPMNTWGDEPPKHAIDYMASQLKGMIDFLQAHGYAFDMDKLKEEVAFARRLNVLMQEIDLLKQAVPHPIRAFDTVIAMTAPLALSKAGRQIELFERLRDELRARVDRGFGVVEEEKLRLLWCGLCPLYDFKLLNYPERYGAVVVKSMLEFLVGFTCDPETLDPEKPLESMARAQLLSPANPPYRGAVNYFVRAARDYKVDGIVGPVMRSCGLVPGMQRLVKDAVAKELGIPTILVDLDGGDQREYDRAAVCSHLDAFIETLLARKGRR
jgi:benzoyl-CoA reductase/2-hydroxyglutaryl-CoA dehydratase subunit BcrC/BadD/HgdB